MQNFENFGTFWKINLKERYTSLHWCEKSLFGSFPTYEKLSLNFQLQAAIVKREAGRNCGKNCEKKKRKKKRRNSKKGKGKGKKQKNRSKKGKKRTRPGKKRAKSGQNEGKESKTKRRQRQKTTGTARGGEGRQISGNATSCAMKAIKYARLFEGKATSIFRQVVFVTID